MNYARSAVLTADKTLKRESIVMVIHPDEVAALPEPTLPEGCSFRMYEHGDAATWAHITTIVEEYDDEAKADQSFTNGFMQKEELKRRLVFVTVPDGTAVATSMAWMFEENGRRFGRVHWICNDPAHQGKGIGLNLRLGVHPVRKSHPILRKVNDYDEAVEVLRTIVPDKMPEKVFEMFIERSED